MAGAVDLALAFGLKPKDAIDYFVKRGYKQVATWDWQELWKEQHARAFTVAKVMQLDVLHDIHDSLKEAIDTGQTFDAWKKNLEPTLRAKGWWGKREVVNEDTGEIKNVDLSNPWRLETIYRTNTQTSMMAGRWQRFQENADTRPYLMYVAIMDAQTRPAHAAMNGRVFRIDDPIWQSCYPPNGFNCRCRVRALSERDIEAKGIKVAESGDDLKEFTDNDTRYGEVERVSYKGPGMQKAFAPDVGWNYNPGEVAFSPPLDKYPPALAEQFGKAIKAGDA